MAKEYYDQKINKNTDWGGDASTGNLQVKGNRVQEFIKDSLNALDQKSPAVFAEFVDNVTVKTNNVGSDYEKIVYDTTRHCFLAAKEDSGSDKYYRNYDLFADYNEGTYPNAHPYAGKVYICGGNTYVYDGTALVSTSKVATEESVRSIVSSYEPAPEPEEESES